MREYEIKISKYIVTYNRSFLNACRGDEKNQNQELINFQKVQENKGLTEMRKEAPMDQLIVNM